MFRLFKKLTISMTKCKSVYTCGAHATSVKLADMVGSHSDTTITSGARAYRQCTLFDSHARRPSFRSTAPERYQADQKLVVLCLLVNNSLCLAVAEHSAH